MSDLPPQLGEIPHTSDFKVPTLGSERVDYPAVGTTTSTAGPNAAHVNGSANGSATAPDQAKSTLVNAKDTMAASAQQAASTIANHPVTQNVKETINNVVIRKPSDTSLSLTAPVTEVVKDQSAKTSAEFDALKNARRTPDATTANDQSLTHYHSFFYTLLSWENPRVTGIAFVFSILSIFAFRYVPALSWLFKSLYLVLGSVALVEGVTKALFGTGVSQSVRPRRYVTIPREALEASLEDVEQLINFFVIEFQRILYAENVLHTLLAFLVSFTSYYLIKVVPTWGLLLIGTSLLFTVPLVYVTNQETIDYYLASANEVVSAQAQQFRDIASQQTSQVTSTVKQYAGDYSVKAQELVGSKRSPSSTYRSQDFPVAPKSEPIVDEVKASKPIAA